MKRVRRFMLRFIQRSSQNIVICLGVLLACAPISMAQTAKMTPEELDSHIKNRDSGFYIDFFDYHIWDPIEDSASLYDRWSQWKHGIPEAKDVNQYGQVPDSGWFTNRNGKTKMSADQLAQGANMNDGPTGNWKIVKGKSQGRTPGFYIEDARGDKYLIKIDGKHYPEMASGAEVVASKFFYAIGYNVPQYTITYFSKGQLMINPGAKLIGESGFEESLTQESLQEMLDRSYQLPDGRFRASASKLLEGIPKGPFSFNSRRKGDPEDIFSHRKLRVIRALRVFSAWLNHNDIRRGNTLDMITQDEAGTAYVKHYLIDFGSALGSQTVREKWSETSREYLIDIKQTLLTALTLGIYQRAWLDTSHVVYPSVGYFEADLFEPKAWKQEIPNYAFSHMTEEDADWAAQIVGSFSDDQIRSIVKTGQYSNPEAEQYIIDILIDRRNKVVAAWRK